MTTLCIVRTHGSSHPVRHAVSSKRGSDKTAHGFHISVGNGDEGGTLHSFFLSKEARSTGLTFNTDFAHTESTQPNVCTPRNVGFRCATRLVREHSPHHDKPLSEEVRKSTFRYRARPRPSSNG